MKQEHDGRVRCSALLGGVPMYLIARLFQPLYEEIHLVWIDDDTARIVSVRVFLHYRNLLSCNRNR